MKFSSVYKASLLTALVHRTSAAESNTTDEGPMLSLSTEPLFHFGLVIALGTAISGGADIAPVLGVAKNFKDGDMASYSDEFYALANHTKAQAENPDNAYDAINVRDTWFSAANYFRTASAYHHRNWSNPLINGLWAEQTAAFDKGIAALPVPGERVRIPATKGNFTIEAIWYSATERKDVKLPTLIIGNGFDAAQEDAYHTYVVPALARGWNCITYEGPGQPTVRRNQNIGFIPEWERVLTPVVDYVLSQKSHLVDSDRLALVGNSLGGYLAARAAAFEPRLSAALLIDGVWDVYDGYAAQLSPELLSIYEAGNYTEFDHKVLSQRELGELPINVAWGLDYGLWATKTHTPSSFFTQVKRFNVKDIVDKINIPVFIGDPEYENTFPGQPKKVKDALGDKATLHPYTGVAGLHCQAGAAQELATTMFAWLNKTLG